MKIILVSVGNFQEYIIDNINNLLLFGNTDITVITNADFFIRFKNIPVTLIDCETLSDNNFNNTSTLDRNFREGFWHYCSLRFFYIYSYMKTYEITDCLHVENDVITYMDFNTMNFKENKVYVTFDADNRVIPGIMYIPNYKAFEPIIANYDNNKNDMDNLCKFDENVLLSLPIIPMTDKQDITKYNKLYDEFELIFDACAMGQYLDGVDRRNNSGNDPAYFHGFVNETCVIKYNKYKFVWIRMDKLYVPHLVIDEKKYRICNLHIHSKNLKIFMANNPIENVCISIQPDI